MWRPMLLILALAVVLGGGIALLARSSDDDERPVGSARPDAPAGTFRAALAAACTTANEGFAEAGDFPFSDFDPLQPDTDRLPHVGEYFQQGAKPVTETLYEAVAAIEPPPDFRALHTRLAQDLAKQVAVIRAQAQTAVEGDGPAFTRMVQALGRLEPRLAADARDLRIPACTTALDR